MARFNKDFINKLHVVYRVFIQLFIITKPRNKKWKECPWKADIEIYRQITQIIQEVYPVFNITKQTSKHVRNDQGWPTFKFIDKLHKISGWLSSI
jgi:hypothetical protein